MYDPLELAYSDLSIDPEPMQRCPRIVSILYDVRTTRASEWTVEPETLNLRRNGFVVACADETYDPLVGWKYEWWGYLKDNQR